MEDKRELHVIYTLSLLHIYEFSIRVSHNGFPFVGSHMLLEKNISFTDTAAYVWREHNRIRDRSTAVQVSTLALAVSNFTSCNWWARLIGSVLRFMRWHGPGNICPCSATYSANAPRKSIVLHDCGRPIIHINRAREIPSVSNGILPHVSVRQLVVRLRFSPWKKKAIGVYRIIGE